MPEQFLHGVEVVEVTSGARSIRTVTSSVIGIIGTADDADNTVFPLNTPVLIAGYEPTLIAKLGTTGTLVDALDGIFDQAGAVVVVIRVATGVDAAATRANVIGTVDGSGQYTGAQALLGAESVLGVSPRILIAPTFTSTLGVLTAFVTIATRLRAIIVAEGPSTTDAAAISYAGSSGSDRVFLVDPEVKVLNSAGVEVVQSVSARVAGIIAKVDNDKGFWWSPSNNEIQGITGTERPIDFVLGDANCRANLLNAANVATVIRQNGFRLWGNRTLSSDPKWAFLSVRRTADIIQDSILRAHLWAVDRNITKTYLTDVADGVNGYLKSLKAQGAIINGECRPSADLNTPANIAQGKVFFDIRFTAPYPAEHITFRSALVNDYLTEIL
jgi:phage tail sheath protein FI